MYPAISVSRSVNEIKGSSVPKGGGTKGYSEYTIPIASLEGDGEAVPEKAVTQLDRFES